MDSLLIQGQNSYATLAEADIYVKMNYGKYSPLRVIWSVLDAEEKDVYMFNSMAQIESVPISGRRYRTGQPLQFPRHDGSGEIPQAVKAAQVENALAILNAECLEYASKQFQIMQSLGIMKNIKYSKREVSDAVLEGTTPGQGNRTKLLTSDKAETLLRPFMGYYRS